MGRLADALVAIVSTVVGGVVLALITQRLADAKSSQKKVGPMSSTLLGILMVIAGVGLASGGVFILTRKSPSTAESKASPPISKTAPEGTNRQVLTSEEKGNAFEKWVVKRFSRDYFSIKEWRGDKYVDGIYAESTTNPDLEIEFRLGAMRKMFAVECKWRAAFDQGDQPFIEWASERQIATYQEFAASRSIPVFVVIGIGGRPDDPENVYVVNLKNLKYPKATAEYLSRFRRSKKDGDFFFDDKKPDLR